MHPELENLVHLQHTEQRILTLSGQIASYPKKIKDREAALALAESELAANIRAIAAEDKKRRDLESTADDLRRKAARYRTQMNTVQNQSQVEALQHEIEFAEQEVRRLEDEALTCMLQSETFEAENGTAVSVVEKRKLQLTDEKSQAKISLRADDAERMELQAKRKAIRATITEDMLSLYDRLAASRKTAVAEAVDHRCSTCQMVIRPQKWNELDKEVLTFCDSCGRILYYSAPVDLSQDIALPRRSTSQH